jgi:hypothetical protein
MLQSTDKPKQIPLQERVIHGIAVEAEIAKWLDWMMQDLPAGGVELPDEETSTLFATLALGLADRVQRISKRLPGTLEERLIQAAILYQCWKWRAEARTKVKRIAAQREILESEQANGSFRSVRGDQLMMKASDGFEYLVKFPMCDKETTLATEIVCLEFARQMGLPVPKAKIILVSQSLANETGISGQRLSRYVSRNHFFYCLGLRMTGEELGAEECRNLATKLSPRMLSYFIGSLVFDVLTLNYEQHSPSFQRVKQRTEPIFMNHSQCLSDSDWPRFLDTTYKETRLLNGVANRIKSFDQLQPWLRRARGVDMNRMWTLVFTLPPEWYGEQRMLVTDVLRKLEDRSRNLSRLILYLIDTGHFPNIKPLERSAA